MVVRLYFLYVLTVTLFYVVTILELFTRGHIVPILETSHLAIEEPFWSYHPRLLIGFSRVSIRLQSFMRIHHVTPNMIA